MDTPTRTSTVFPLAARLTAAVAVTLAVTAPVTPAVTCDRDNPGYTAGQVAQCVQRSGFPDRYDQSQAKARSLLAEAPPSEPTPL
ncbi:hypothetical protein [Micromonospora sp. NBC_01412]|uniref:hypothetical protein n=1 Tax=Micromonospora sp. NBC_01412 TaxID=2903590 RepID=UPI003243D40E